MFLAYIANLNIILLAAFTIISIIKNYLNKEVNKSFKFIFALSFCLLLQLLIGFVTTNYHIENVFLNSHQFQPLIYRIAAIWGSHEGSLLVIYSMTSFFVFLIFKKISLNRLQKGIALCILLFWQLFILISSNPFRIISTSITSGMGLNPLLQDYGLAIHPPILYIGYTSLIMPFLMIFGEFNKAFYKYSVIISFSFLTLGIGLGSWWAYRELGWGGFWFWDPVENISLLSWFMSVSMLHFSNYSNNKYAVFSSYLGFVYANFATFIVRSGLLTSVHSFAETGDRGIWLLLYVLALLIFPIYYLSTKKINHINMNKMIILNFVFMHIGAFIVIFAIVSPILYYLIFKDHISLGAAYYEKTLLPIMSPILIFAGVAVTKKFNLNKKLLIVSILAAIITKLTYDYFYIQKFWPVYTAFIASWLMVFSLLDINFKKMSIFLGHFGFGLLVFSANLAINSSNYHEQSLKINQQIKFQGYNINLVGFEDMVMQNYATRKAIIKIEKNNFIFFLNPEIRLYPIEQTTTTDVDYKSFLFSDLYVAFSDYSENTGAFLRFYDRKMISWIWISIIMIFAQIFIKRKNYGIR